MSVINTQPLAGASGNQGVAGYNLTKSLRFRANAGASLTRTPASAGNRKTFTISYWFKRGSLADAEYMLLGTTAASLNFQIYFGSGSDRDKLIIGTDYAAAYRKSNAVFRDPSAWYHLVVTVDTTNATDSNRIRAYINGTELTWATNNSISQNADLGWNTNTAHAIGTKSGSSLYFDGYTTEFNFVDGTALTPSSFGETDTITGVWKPKRFSGTYGTNGFYLPFTDVATTSGSNAGLGKDFSGNGNYWNTSNISVSGATNDSMSDVPTLTSETAANFCTLNPVIRQYSSVDSTGSVQPSELATDGNLRVFFKHDGVGGSIYGTHAIPNTGKWYFEYTDVYEPANAPVRYSQWVGIAPADTIATQNGTYSGGTSDYGYCYGSEGQLYQAYSVTGISNQAVDTYANYGSGDVIGVAFDADAHTLKFYKNNTLITTVTGVISRPAGFFPCAGGIKQNTGSGWNTSNIPAEGLFNFGQTPFVYTPPTGHKCINTYNFPDATIVAGNKVFDATTYTGNGSTQTITNAGGFKPDFVWIKNRASNTEGNVIFDSNRGALTRLLTDSSTSEASAANSLTAFNSNGFSLGSWSGSNTNANAHIAWQWQAGQGTTSTNTNGSITSTVSVNPTAGFSVVTYSAGSAGSTVGHGLGVAPKFIIAKGRNAASSWAVYHGSLGGTNWLLLNDTSAVHNTSQEWSNTDPTSTVFTVGATNANSNYAGGTFVAYCWAEIAGFSKFGRFTGNGTSDNSFVYTGFKPRYVVFKATTGAGSNWVVVDSARDTYNVVGNLLNPDNSGLEYTASVIQVDFLSNGFKVRGSWAGFTLDPIYTAFAENPFKNSLAR